MKLLSILLILFVISQVFGGYERGYLRCLKKFKGYGCHDEDDCGPYGSCGKINGAFRSCVGDDGVSKPCGV